LLAISLAGVIALAASASSATPNQIGLVCKGTKTSFPSSGKTEAPWQRAFSMDFKGSKGWVVGAQAQFDIVATETRITFWNGYEIDRTTGSLSGKDDNQYMPSRVTAECELGTFTPMPAKKF
jgi:hypothetical protein